MKSNKIILAKFDDKTISVYQAYNNSIANEALRLGTFGSNFKLERMTWIKPSFLWMMYRSGWGTKKDQERILEIKIYKEAFNEILSQAILSTYKSNLYETHEIWKNKLKNSEVRCQWDPDKNIYGDNIERRAIQLGLRGNLVKKYVNEYIYKINDISENVHNWKNEINKRDFNLNLIPKEVEYPVSENIKKILDM